MHPVAAAYRDELEQLDALFAGARQRHPGVIPCRTGCSACCHGPFDISVADLLLLREGLANADAEVRARVAQQAEELMEKVRILVPDWTAPWDIADLGEARFDVLVEALADQACPLLDPAGTCSVYSHRPLVCRMMGLPVATPQGGVIPNACPIQEQFPNYAALPPQPFDLDATAEAEEALLEAAAIELFGSPLYAGFETTIATAILGPFGTEAL